MLSSPFDTKAGRVVVELLAEGWTLADIAAADPAELRQVFAARGCRLSGPLAGRLIARATSALPAHPAATAGKPATLAGLLGALAALDLQIAGLEAEMAPLLAATQGAKLTQIRGVATVAAAGFVAFVGHTGRWSEWSKVWRRPGWTRPAANPAPPTKAMASAGKAGPGAAGDPGPSRRRLPPTGPLPHSYQARLGQRKHPKVALAAIQQQLAELELRWKPGDRQEL